MLLLSALMCVFSFFACSGCVWSHFTSQCFKYDLSWNGVLSNYNNKGFRKTLHARFFYLTFTNWNCSDFVLLLLCHPNTLLPLVSACPLCLPLFCPIWDAIVGNELPYLGIKCMKDSNEFPVITGVKHPKALRANIAHTFNWCLCCCKYYIRKPHARILQS